MDPKFLLPVLDDEANGRAAQVLQSGMTVGKTVHNSKFETEKVKVKKNIVAKSLRERKAFVY